MIQTEIELTEEQQRALEELAAIYQIRVSELIRRSIVKLVESPEEIEMAKGRQRAMALAGRFHFESDLSEHHDDYLADAY